MSATETAIKTQVPTFVEATLDGRVPPGPVQTLWERTKFEMKLVNPTNRRRFKVIVVGSGLAGGAAAATLGEQGYFVECYAYQDSPRRAHSVAAQGGINAAKNYRNDGDSTYRLFYDTVKGGDFRAREANVYRLAEVSNSIIDQCVAQGVPFAREYGGMLDNRSFGGAQVARTFYARGQTGQQLLLGAYQALSRQIAAGTVQMFTRTEMLDLIVVDGARAESWCAICAPARSPRVWRMWSCWRRVATAMPSTCRPMPKGATARQSGVHTSEEPILPILATHKSTQRVSPLSANTNPN